jgi:tetratricopeptide (TPR) repeat protein
LGFLSIFLGDFQKAIEYFSKAVEISSEYGIQHQAIASKVHIGVSYWLAGNFDSARQMIQAASSLSLSSGSLAQIFPMICQGELLVILGQYDEAQKQLTEVEKMTDRYFSDRFTTGRLTRNLGWIALAEKEYPEAKTHFTKSIYLYQFLTDDEQIAWSQAGLARALIGEGKIENAKGILVDALWTVIEIKAFIPLLFLLPITLLVLERENLSLTRDVYLAIQNSGFLTKSQFFEDICYQYLPSEIRKISIHSVDKPENNRVDPLWAIAAKILSTWMQNWMQEPQMMKSIPSQDKERDN